MSISFALSIVLERYFGDKTYGDFVLSLSTIEILGVFSLIGYNQFFLVHIPKLKKNVKTVSFIYLKAKKDVILVSILLMCFIIGITFLDIPLFEHETTRMYFRYGALSLPIFAVSTLASALINSLKKVVLSQLTDRVVRPLIVLIGVLILAYYKLSAINIIYIYIGSVIIGYFIDIGFRKKHFTLSNNPISSFIITDKKKSLFFILIINFTTMIAVKTDTFMMGWISGTEYSGVYNIYIKFANFISIGLSSIVVAIIPYISEQIKLNQLIRARNSIKFAARLSLAIGFLALIGILVVTPYFLDLYTSPIYEESINALYLICGAAIANVLSGPSGAVLLAANKLKHLLFAQVSAMILNVILNTFLIPTHGISGAAFATLISTFYLNVLLYYFSIKLVKLNPTAFGK